MFLQKVKSMLKIDHSINYCIFNDTLIQKKILPLITNSLCLIPYKITVNYFCSS